MLHVYYYVALLGSVVLPLTNHVLNLITTCPTISNPFIPDFNILFLFYNNLDAQHCIASTFFRINVRL